MIKRLQRLKNTVNKYMADLRPDRLTTYQSQRKLGRKSRCIKMAFLRVETGKNTSTVIPASRKRRRKGNPVVPDETVMYGYESSATLTTDRLHYKLQTRPLVRESKSKAIVRQKKGKSKTWSWAPKGWPTPRHTD
jgi:hypothetical protein